MKVFGERIHKTKLFKPSIRRGALKFISRPCFRFSSFERGVYLYCAADHGLGQLTCHQVDHAAGRASVEPLELSSTARLPGCRNWNLVARRRPNRLKNLHAFMVKPLSP